MKEEINCCVSYTLSFSHLVIIESLEDINVLVHFQFFLKKDCAPVWLRGRALRQWRKRLWVRFPGNTHTNENV